jgi:hypothetical protein
VVVPEVVPVVVAAAGRVSLTRGCCESR